jgi:hypothetical protein
MLASGAAILFAGELTFMAGTGPLRCRSEFATEPRSTPHCHSVSFVAQATGSPLLPGAQAEIHTGLLRL